MSRNNITIKNNQFVGLTNMSEKYSFNVKEGTFAEAILRTYGPLNFLQKFKEKYADQSFKILLNPKDGQYAALINVENGKMTVEGIKNKPKEKLDKKTVGWDGFIETTIALFDELGKGKLSQGDIAKKMVARKIKIKNVNVVAKLSEMMSFRDK